LHFESGSFSTQGTPNLSNVIKRNLITGLLDNTFYNPVGICVGCGVNLDSLTLVGTELFVGVDAAALYRGTPVYFAFPLDGGTGALLDP
jgi:hypothetical protein